MSILDMSISGAMMIFAVIVIRVFAINRLPKKTFMVLWGAALVRLLIPYSIPSACSVYSLIGKFVKPHTAVSAVSPVKIERTLYAQTVPEMELAKNTTSKIGTAIAVVFADPWRAVWLAGVAVLAVFFTVSYVKLRREFQASLPVCNETAQNWLDAHRLRRSISIRYSDRISAPLTFGVLHPVILVPKTLGWPDHVDAKRVLCKDESAQNPDSVQDKEQKAIIPVRDMDFIKDSFFIRDSFFILEHEYIHIVRFDAVTKLVLTAALCIHWFNPLVWGMYILANRDIELSCDEEVIHRFGEDSKSAYANILIRMEEIRSGFAPLCNNFSKNAIEERIVAIMKIKKYTLPVITGAIVLVASVLTVFATSAAGASDGAEAGGIADDKRKDYEKYLAKKTEADFMDEENIVSAHAEITYNEPEDTYSIELSLFSEGAVSEERVCKYYDMLSKIYHSAKIFINGNESLLSESSLSESAHLEILHDGDELQTAQTFAGEAVSADTGTQYAGQMSAGDGAQSVVQITQTIDGPTSIFRVAHDDGSGCLEDSYSSDDLAEYASFGLVIKNGSFYYKDKKVRHFVDDFNVGGGVATRNMYTSEEGSVDVRAVRQPTKNEDGSIDPEGKIIGLEIEEYALADLTDNYVVSCESEAESEMLIEQTDEGAQEIAFGGEAIQTSEAYAVQSNDTGKDFMEMFSAKGKYGKLGIRFEKNEVYGNVYYKGMLVHALIDRSPDGGYFSVRSTDEGGINLKTVYDADNVLTGVEIVDSEYGW